MNGFYEKKAFGANEEEVTNQIALTSFLKKPLLIYEIS